MIDAIEKVCIVQDGSQFFVAVEGATVSEKRFETSSTLEGALVLAAPLFALMPGLDFVTNSNGTCKFAISSIVKVSVVNVPGGVALNPSSTWHVCIVGDNISATDFEVAGSQSDAIALAIPVFEAIED